MDALAALAVFAELALSEAPENDLLQAAADLVVEQVRGDRSAVLALCPQDARLVVRCAFAWPDATAGGPSVPPGLAAHAWRALEARGPVVVDDAATEDRFAAADLLESAHGLRSGIAIAVRVGGQTFGVLSAHARRPGAFGTPEVRFVAAVARLLALATRRPRALAA